jgi:predicted MPP superfamily phosphohydrolase
MTGNLTGNLADLPVAEQHQTLTRRKFLVRSSLAAAGGLALYSGEVARHELSVVTQPLAIRNLPDAFHHFRIVQISDIHYDEYTEPSFVRRVLARVNALAPDLVLLTGDFISFTPLSRSFAVGAMHRCAETLRAIACPQRFAVMGNHDSFLGAPEIRPILAAADIPLLVNQYVPIERGGQRLWLCGIHDPVTHVPDLDLAIPARPDGPVLLMSHGPDYADTLLTHPRGPLVDVMFSGHTHGGQVRLPFVRPMHLPSGGRKYVEGLIHLDRLQLYVNRGIGTTGVPFRLNCPPEITLFTLQRA